jgi:hypothetical protein
MALDIKAIADKMVQAVRDHTQRAIAPIIVRQESADQLIDDLERRIAELESKR